MKAVRLAIDVMGGDQGPDITLPACRAFLATHDRAELVLVGRPEVIAVARNWPRTRLVEASEVVEMHDPVEIALRKKKDSSMRVAIGLLKGRGRWLRTG